MPSSGAGRSCSVCSHPAASEISKFLAAGGSKSQCVARFAAEGGPRLSASACDRHRRNCLRIRSVPTKNSPGSNALAESGGPARFASDATPIASPADLLDRLRSLFRLGDLLEEAYQRRDVDACVKLAREYRAAAESYAKVAGWMTDGLQLNVDARQQIAAIANLTTDEIRSALERLSAPTITANDRILPASEPA